METIDLDNFRNGAREALAKHYGLEDGEDFTWAHLLAGFGSIVFAILVFVSFLNQVSLGITIFLEVLLISLSIFFFSMIKKDRRLFKPVKYHMKEIRKIKNAKELGTFLYINYNLRKIKYFHKWLILFSNEDACVEEKTQEQSFFPEVYLKPLKQLETYFSKKGIDFGIDPSQLSLLYMNSDYFGILRLMVSSKEPCKRLKYIQGRCEEGKIIEILFENPEDF